MQKIPLSIAVLLFMFSTHIWAAEDEEVVEKNPAYISLGKPMVLNLSSNKGRLTFLQLQADVLVNDSASEEMIKAHIPAIRHQLIVLLSEQSARDMKSSAKREKIRSIATAQVQELMAELGSSSKISDILFSSFLVQ